MAELLPGLFNFALMATILYLAAKKPILQSLKLRSESVAQQMTEAQGMARESTTLLNEAQTNWSSCEAHAKNLMEETKQMLKRLRETSIARAQSEAERLLSDAKRMGNSEIQKAKSFLQKEISKRSLALTRTYMREQLSEDDKKGLVGDYLGKIGNGSAS